MERLKEVFKYNNSQVYETGDFDSLPEATKLTLEPQLAEAASVGFKRPLTEAFREDVGNHIRGGSLFIIMTAGKAEGFGLFQSFPEFKAVYIAGVVKKPTSPSKIMEDILLGYLISHSVETGVVRTQNDRVVEIMANHFQTIVALDQKAGLGELDLLKKMNLLSPNLPFDRDNLIVKGYYGGPMIEGEERRRSREERIRAHTDKLDYYAGDAALLIGYGVRGGGGGF